MHYTFGSVRASIVAPVHSRVHFCREGALVQLSGSRNTLECRYMCRDHKDFYHLYINNQLMLDGSVHHISTMGAALSVGYGDGIMDDDACRAAAEKVNKPCTSLEDGIANITPLLGLLNAGTYLIADYELYPFHPYNQSHALDAAECYNDEGKKYCGYGCFYDAPLYILPSQRASRLNPERIRYYMDLFRQLAPHQTPRAVALYLNGAVSLLLDGHHKAAAAAALGRRVKTLLIFPVPETDALKKALKNRQKLEMCHTRWDYNADTFEKDWLVDTIAICDEQLQALSYVHSLGSLPKSKEAYTPLPETDDLPWGRVPEEFCQALKTYPQRRTIRLGTRIPPDKIKLCMKRIMDGPWEEFKCTYAQELLAFHELFPDSPMLTEQNIVRLMKEKAKL